MPDPKPIKQRIDVVADTKGAEQVSRAMAELEARNKAEAQQVEKATRAAQRKGQQLDRLRDRLRSLTAKEIEHEGKVKEGVAADTQATQASQRRQQQAERLSRAIATQEDKQEVLNRRVKESVNTHRAAAQSVDKTSKSSDRAGLSVKSLASAFGGLGIGLTASGGVLAALRLVRDELQNIRDLQQAAFQEQVTLASAQRQLKRNLVDASDEEIEAAIKGANKVAGEENVPNEIVTLALADALSSTGGNVDLALRNVSLAAQVIPDQPDQIPVFAGGLGDIQSALGIDDPEVALGFLLKATGQSRITDFSRASTNIPPAIQAAIAQGFSPAEAASLFSNITTGTSDRTGESSRTAVIQLAGELTRFFEERGLEERGGAAIARLQQDEALRGEFNENVSIETRARETVSSLITPGTPQAQAFLDRQAPFGNAAELEAAALDKIRQLESGEIEQVADIDRRLGSAAERLLAGNTSAGRFGAIRENLDELLLASGQNKLASRFDSAKFDLESFNTEGDAIQAILDVLESRSDDILGGGLTGRLHNDPPLARPIDHVSEVEADAFIVLQDLIFGLKSIAGSTDQTEEDHDAELQEMLDLFDDTLEFRDDRGRGFDEDKMQRVRNLSDALRDRLDSDGSSLGSSTSQSPVAPIAPSEDAGSSLGGSGGGLINHGTIYMNTGDPLIDDLDGRDRLA